MSGGMQKVREIRVEKAKIRRKKREREREMREERTEKKKLRRKETMKVKKVVAKEWKIWDKEEETAKSEEDAKRLVPERFHKQIYVFGKKASERIYTRKLQNHTIDMKEGIIPRKRRVYLLSREKKEEVYKFISKQLRKEYIKLSKLPQMVLVFFVGQKDSKKQIVQNYRYLNGWTIKNNYPLSLISDIVENIGTNKVFTKIDLR